MTPVLIPDGFGNEVEVSDSDEPGRTVLTVHGGHNREVALLSRAGMRRLRDALDERLEEGA